MTDYINRQAAIDVIEMMFCKECKRKDTMICSICGVRLFDDDFCNYGEKRFKTWLEIWEEEKDEIN